MRQRFQMAQGQNPQNSDPGSLENMINPLSAFLEGCIHNDTSQNFGLDSQEHCSALLVKVASFEQYYHIKKKQLQSDSWKKTCPSCSTHHPSGRNSVLELFMSTQFSSLTSKEERHYSDGYSPKITGGKPPLMLSCFAVGCGGQRGVLTKPFWPRLQPAFFTKTQKSKTLLSKLLPCSQRFRNFIRFSPSFHQVFTRFQKIPDVEKNARTSPKHWPSFGFF